MADLPIHDILYGGFHTDPSDGLNTWQWSDEDGINVMGTPLGLMDFI